MGIRSPGVLGKFLRLDRVHLRSGLTNWFCVSSHDRPGALNSRQSTSHRLPAGLVLP
jgi:hypothetical protein